MNNISSLKMLLEAHNKRGIVYEGAHDIKRSGQKMGYRRSEN